MARVDVVLVVVAVDVRVDELPSGRLPQDRLHVGENERNRREEVRLNAAPSQNN